MNSNKQQLGDVGLNRIFVCVCYATDLISSLPATFARIKDLHESYTTFVYLAGGICKGTERQSKARFGGGWEEWAVNRILDMNFRPRLSAEGSSYICFWSWCCGNSWRVQGELIPSVSILCSCEMCSGAPVSRARAFSPELGRDVAAADTETREVFLTIGCYFGMLIYVLGTKPKPKSSNDLSLSHIYTCRFLT